MFANNLIDFLNQESRRNGQSLLWDFTSFMNAISCISVAEVAEMLDISRSTIYNKIKVDGDFYDESFPQPLNFGEGSTRFVKFEIALFVIKRAEERDKALAEKKKALASKECAEMK